MELPLRISITRATCQAAMDSPPLSQIEAFLEGRGLSNAARIQLLRQYTAIHTPTSEMLELQDCFRTQNPDEPDASALARALLVRASIEALELLPTFPVDDSVKHLFCKEFAFYASTPDPSTREMFAIDGYPFIAMGKIALLERFPAGQQQWEVSGFPRRWFAKIRISLLPRVAWFLGTKVCGLGPYFVSHMAVTNHKARFLLEREYLKSFYRMASSIEKQPSVKALMGVSWLHSRETHRVSPHLAFLNRPHLEAGGIYVDIGPAPRNAGFVAGDKERKALYEAGDYKPTLAVVICTRDQAIRWKHRHSELEALCSVP